MAMTDQPHDPTVIEAFDQGEWTIRNEAISNWLLERSTRRLQEARDRATRLHYTDAIQALRDNLTAKPGGEGGRSVREVRDILREFARFSPRDDSPTSRLTVQQVFDELMVYERHQAELDRRVGDPAHVDAANQQVYEGPLTIEQSTNRDIEYIQLTRMRMINELHERIAVAEAHSNQELVDELEEQLDWWINVI